MKELSDIKIMMLKGESGSDITGIEKVSSLNNVDTYRITLSDGTTHDFSVVNGAEIVSIEKTSEVDYSQTYTVKMSDGRSFDFVVDAVSPEEIAERYDNNLLVNSDFRMFYMNDYAKKVSGWKLSEADGLVWTSNGLLINVNVGTNNILQSGRVAVPWGSTDTYTVTVECGKGGASTETNVKSYTGTLNNGGNVSVTTDEGNVIKVTLDGGILFVAIPTFNSAFAIRRIKLERGEVATSFVKNLKDFSVLETAYKNAEAQIEEHGKNGTKFLNVEDNLTFSNGKATHSQLLDDGYFTDASSIAVIANGVATTAGMTVSITNASLSNFGIVITSTDTGATTQRVRLTFIGC